MTAGVVLDRPKEVEEAKSAKKRKMDKNRPGPKRGKQTKKNASVGVEENMDEGIDTEKEAGANKNLKKKGAFEQTRKRSEEVEEGSESDKEGLEDEIEEARCNESDAAELEEYQQEMELDEYEEVSYIEPSETNTIPNCYVIVDILGGSRRTTHFSYVCKVDNIMGDEVEVTGLLSVNAAKTKFILKENDCFSVGKEQVKAILPASSVEKEGRRIVHKFPGSISVKEK